MDIQVFGKKDCGNCERMVEILREGGQSFSYYLMEDIQTFFRDSSMVPPNVVLEVQAVYCMTDELPIVVVQGRGYGWEDAHKLFTGEYPDDECTNGVCTL